MVSLSVSSELYYDLYITDHNRQRQKERNLEWETERKRRRLPKCLKTLSGKYLAPKHISLFDQRPKERGENKERERFELKWPKVSKKFIFEFDQLTLKCEHTMSGLLQTQINKHNELHVAKNAPMFTLKIFFDALQFCAKNPKKVENIVWIMS